MKYLQIMSVFFLSISCSLIKQKSKDIIEPVIVINSSLKIKTSGFKSLIPNNSITLQNIEFKSMDKFEQVQVIFKHDNILAINAINQIGIELFYVEIFKDNTIKYQSSIPDKYLKSFFNNIMADMLMALLNHDELKKSLIGDVRIKEDYLQRQLYEGNKRIITINYGPMKNWPYDLKITNYLSGYKLTVKNGNYELLHK